MRWAKLENKLVDNENAHEQKQYKACAAEQGKRTKGWRREFGWWYGKATNKIE